jgi:hypothetical protein
MRPVYPVFPSLLAPCLLGGRMLGPGRLVHFRRIGLDHPIGVPSDAVTERDNRRWRLAAGLAPWSSFLAAMESGAACGHTSGPPEPAVLAGREPPRGADPGQGAFLTRAVSSAARPGPSRVHEGDISAPASQCAASPGSSGTRHDPAWTAAGTPGAPYGGKQGCAPTAASPRAAVRRIGLIPSKIVKILAARAVSAGQRPEGAPVSARIQHAPSEMNPGLGSARVGFRSWYERTPRRYLKVLERSVAAIGGPFRSGSIRGTFSR